MLNAKDSDNSVVTQENQAWRQLVQLCPIFIPGFTLALYVTPKILIFIYNRLAKNYKIISKNIVIRNDEKVGWVQRHLLSCKK